LAIEIFIRKTQICVNILKLECYHFSFSAVETLKLLIEFDVSIKYSQHFGDCFSKSDYSDQKTAIPSIGCRQKGDFKLPNVSFRW